MRLLRIRSRFDAEDVRMRKSMFKTAQEAEAYKNKRQLFGMAVEPMAGDKFGLVFPIRCHVTVVDSAGVVVNHQALTRASS